MLTIGLWTGQELTTALVQVFMDQGVITGESIPIVSLSTVFLA
jgi:uncharacterized protein YoaH (UPF0181 family)